MIGNIRQHPPIDSPVNLSNIWQLHHLQSQAKICREAPCYNLQLSPMKRLQLSADKFATAISNGWQSLRWRLQSNSSQSMLLRTCAVASSQAIRDLTQPPATLS
jgi:hypothetical protein